MPHELADNLTAAFSVPAMSANTLEIGHIACKLTDKCGNTRALSSVQCPRLHRMRLARGTKRPNWTGVDCTGVDRAAEATNKKSNAEQKCCGCCNKKRLQRGPLIPPNRSLRARGWTWRAEVGSEGAPKPKPLKPFNVTFKTRLGKYVTMVSLCVLACVCVCWCVVGACIIAAC